MTKLTDIEGVGPSYSEKLTNAGVTSIENLLKTCCGKPGRVQLASKSGLSESQILEWVNRADLCRIKGVSTQYADLLECAGIDSVPELGQRNAGNLHAKMLEVNAQKKLVRRPPALSAVQDWCKQAKALPKMVTH
ncbi:MAG: DUF4332 domain-containing protein [Porticoccaceae bacterium]